MTSDAWAAGDFERPTTLTATLAQADCIGEAFGRLHLHAFLDGLMTLEAEQLELRPRHRPVVLGEGIDWQLEASEVATTQLAVLLREVLSPEEFHRLETVGEVDFSYLLYRRPFHGAARWGDTQRWLVLSVEPAPKLRQWPVWGAVQPPHG